VKQVEHIWETYHKNVKVNIFKFLDLRKGKWN